MKISLQKLFKHKIKIGIAVIALIAWYFCLPKTLFHEPSSTVIESTDGKLLDAKIARERQWRFPEADSIPYKFKKCIIYFEDQYFYKHPGFNPVSIGKSIITNIKAKRIVRGGSTLSQQVIRLSRKEKKRTYTEKLIEVISLHA